jgi:hypothetical protein
MRIRRLLPVLGIAIVFGGNAACGHNSPTEPTPVCSYTISPNALAFGSDGGNGSVAVTAPATCTWTATAGASWLTISAGATSSGPGNVAYSVASNPAPESRSGTLTIGGQTHTVTQQGRPATVCSYELSPSSADVGQDASNGTFAIGAPSDCAWTATSSASWLVVTSGSQGSGNGIVSYGVARNPDPVGRTGAIAVADKTFIVRQGGDIGSCQYSLSPVAFDPCMPAGSATATLTTQAGCSWTVAPNTSWLTVPSGSSGSGSTAITIEFSENYDAPREGIVMVRWPTQTAGQNIRVAQAGCLYAVSRSAFTVASSGGSGSFDVIQQSQPNTCGGATQDRCRWSAVSDASWITITSSMPQTGDNPVAFTTAPNTAATSRVGTITVKDKVVVITQEGR